MVNLEDITGIVKEGDDIYEEYDEYWDENNYCKDICLKLKCISGEKENLINIEDDILEVINDKAFDGIATFERRTTNGC